MRRQSSPRCFWFCSGVSASQSFRGIFQGFPFFWRRGWFSLLWLWLLLSSLFHSFWSFFSLVFQLVVLLVFFSLARLWKFVQWVRLAQVLFENFLLCLFVPWVLFWGQEWGFFSTSVQSWMIQKVLTVPVTVGSPTILQDRGFSPESLLSSSQNDLHVFCAMFCALCLASKDGASVHLTDLVLRLSKFSNNEN